MMLNCRNVPESDYFLYARSFHLAARKLAGALGKEPGPFSEFEACPVLALYRQAVLVHLKVLVLGDGCNFLPTRPDKLSIHKTRSLSWLAQFASQIVTALHWEKEFTCDGVEDLADFKSIIEEVNAIDPDSHAFRAPVEQSGEGNVSMPEFLRRIDALLELLDRTADGLAAEWQLRLDPLDEDD